MATCRPESSLLNALTEGNVYAEAAWSPDGAWIAFSVVPCDPYYGYCYGEPSIHVVRPDGSDERPLVKAPATHPAWKP